MRLVPLALLIFLFFSTEAICHEENLIFFRIVNDNTVISFTNKPSPPVPPMVGAIAMRLFDQPFSPEMVNSAFYQVNITKNVIWQGSQVVQYDYRPVAADRFRYVLWVAGRADVVKLEIYNTTGVMMFSGAYLEADKLPGHNPPSFKKVENAKNYYGFTLLRTEEKDDGSIRMLFSDGLNRVSVFRERQTEEREPNTRVVYGNNVYNVTRDGYMYTVVGSIPYEKMEEMLELIDIIPAGAASSTHL